jgi:unsaturated chondroitin disaccharide hydrolase
MMMFWTYLLLYSGATVAVEAIYPPRYAVTTSELRVTLDYAVMKLRAIAPNVTSFPQQTEFEKWTYDSTGGWVGGFWPGMLWMAYLDTGDEQFSKWAQQSALGLSPRINDTSTHDLGFLFSYSWVIAYRLTGDTFWRDGAVQAADSLIQRYNSVGRFIRAWGALGTTTNAGRAIIDTMMNLELLCFASNVTGNSTYQNIAIAHAETTAQYFVRNDSSTCHVFDFDPDTGVPIGENTVQGYSPTSCWARGQSWGVYGFARMFIRTGIQEFLEVSQRLANWTLDHITDDYVPVWDYHSPYAPFDVKDSSAAAVTAAGMLDLFKLTGIPQYEEAGLRFIDALSSSCLTNRSTRADAIVSRATVNRPDENGIEVSVPYGDYFLMEAILRLLRPSLIDQALGL